MSKKVVKKVISKINVETKKTDVKPNRQFFQKLFKIIVSILVLAILVVLSMYGYGKIQQHKLNKAQATLIPNTVKKILTNPETKIRSIENLQKVSGVYQFILKLETNGKKADYVIYMTTDGKIVFTSGIKVDGIKDVPANQNSATSSATPSPAK